MSEVFGCSNCASLGPVDLDTVEKVEVKITDAEKARQERIAARPSLDEILNLHDFEVCSCYWYIETPL